jgi:hypothetical protein
LSDVISLVPVRHHLDRRAADLVEAGRGNPDELLSTGATADWLGVSSAWLEIGRTHGYGPPFIRLSPRRTRYLRSAVLAWLAERSHRSTAEYAGAPGTGGGRRAGSRIVDGKVIPPEPAAPAEEGSP